MTDISGIASDEDFYQEMFAELSQVYTGSRDFTASQIQALGALLQSRGDLIAGPGATSRQELFGAALSWLGSAMQTGTLGPLPAAFTDVDTLARAGFELGSAGLTTSIAVEFATAIGLVAITYFVGSPLNAVILAAYIIPDLLPPLYIAIAGYVAFQLVKLFFSPEAGYLGDLLYDSAISPLWHWFKGDPIVLDLNGDGIQLTSLDGSTTHFDFAGDGFAERTAWVSAGDGLLAIDDNGNGIIDNGSELFGSPTEDGFAVLEKLDTNGDGKIDAQDADFGKLRVWIDANGNGVTDPGELKTLSELSIVSISLQRQAVGTTNAGTRSRTKRLLAEQTVRPARRNQ